MPRTVNTRPTSKFTNWFSGRKASTLSFIGSAYSTNFNVTTAGGTATVVTTTASAASAATAVTAVTPTSTFTTVPAAVPAGASASSASRTPGAAELSAPV